MAGLPEPLSSQKRLSDDTTTEPSESDDDVQQQQVPPPPPGPAQPVNLKDLWNDDAKLQEWLLLHTEIAGRYTDADPDYFREETAGERTEPPIMGSYRPRQYRQGPGGYQQDGNSAGQYRGGGRGHHQDRHAMGQYRGGGGGGGRGQHYQQGPRYQSHSRRPGFNQHQEEFRQGSPQQKSFRPADQQQQEERGQGYKRKWDHAQSAGRSDGALYPRPPGHHNEGAIPPTQEKRQRPSDD